EKPSRDIFLLGKAVLSLETANYEESKAAYQELLNTTQDDLVRMQAYLGEADCLYNLSMFKEAISIYKKAAQELLPSTPAQMLDKLHYGSAWAYLKEGEFKNAIEEFQKIAKLSEDKVIKVAALCQVGDTYQDSGDYQKASDAYDSILKDYPDSFYGDYVQYQLGLTLLKASKYDGAILVFKKLIDSSPNSKLRDDAAYSLGLAYFQKEDYSASSEVFRKFEKEFKDSASSPQAIYLLGTSLYNLGKYTDAIEVFKNVIRQFSQDSELVQKAEYEIADCFYQMGDEQEAMTRFKVLRAKYPDSSLTAEVVWWLGEY
ncbi:MAG: tetratricopeptide repeat protein, partial [Candidatus Omnitrophica bacterium]|nr:tetratricopeptide repeat protein [Candidatus Omnitrophota bacterium]